MNDGSARIHRQLARHINRLITPSGPGVYVHFAIGPLADGNGHRITAARTRAGQLQVRRLSDGEWWPAQITDGISGGNL